MSEEEKMVPVSELKAIAMNSNGLGTEFDTVVWAESKHVTKTPGKGGEEVDALPASHVQKLLNDGTVKLSEHPYSADKTPETARNFLKEYGLAPQSERDLVFRRR